MGVDERLKPGAGLFVADLQGARKDKRAVVLGEVLELGLREVVGVELAVELLLSNRNGVLDADGRGGRCDLRGLDERGTEGGNLVVLVEGDIRNRVGDGDAVHSLLEVDVTGGLALERGADTDGGSVDTVARLHEGSGGVFERRVRTLRQRVVDTLPEGLVDGHQGSVVAGGTKSGGNYLVGRGGVVSLDLEVPNFTSAVGGVLGGDGVRDRSRSVGAEHREEDGSEDLLEGKHGSSGWFEEESVNGCGSARVRGETETDESLSELRR